MHNKQGILFFNAFWLTGGVERVTAAVANSLCDAFDVHILVHRAIESDGFQLDDRVQMSSLTGAMNWVDKVIAYIRLQDIRIVIGSSGLIFQYYELYHRLDSEGIPYIVCNHESYFYPLDKPGLRYGILRQKEVQNAAATSFLTSFSERCYRCFAPNGILMPNPCPFEPTDAFIQSACGKTVVAVGRWYDANKRIDRVLRAFRLVLDEVPDARLIVVGPMKDGVHEPEVNGRPVSGWMSYLSLANQDVQFVGPSNQVEDYLKQADVTLMTSESEGFGMVLVEAAAFGVPSVVCDVPGLEDIVTHAENGFIVAQDDVACMASHIVELFEDDLLYQTMRRNSLRMVERFSIAAIGKRWAKLLHTAMEPNPDFTPFQSPMAFTNQEAIVLAQALNGALTSAAGRIGDIRETFLYRPLKPLFYLKDKFSKKSISVEDAK